MLRLITTFILLSYAILSFGQTSQIKYFNNEWLDREVSPKRAKFSQTITMNEDSTVTTEVRNIKQNEIIKSETYKGEEPFGVWILKIGPRTVFLDYNFKVDYFTDENKSDSILRIKEVDFFKDNDSLGYIAPKLASGETDIYEYFSKNIMYPNPAQMENLQGWVKVRFTIFTDGSVGDIAVKKGAHILFAKESIRVTRKLKFSNPLTIHGEANDLRVQLPLAFKFLD